MPEYLAPGVYVEEVSFRSKSIEGVSTSTAGFVGPTRFGPINGEPELLTSFNQFERIFGGLDQLIYRAEDDFTAPLPAMHNYLAHSVRGFFDNGGRRLYVARAFRSLDDVNQAADPDVLVPPGLNADGIATAQIPAPAAGILAATTATSAAVIAANGALTAANNTADGVEVAAVSALEAAVAHINAALPAGTTLPADIDLAATSGPDLLDAIQTVIDALDVGDQQAAETARDDVEPLITDAISERDTASTFDTDATQIDVNAAIGNGHIAGDTVAEADLPSVDTADTEAIASADAVNLLITATDAATTTTQAAQQDVAAAVALLNNAGAAERVAQATAVVNDAGTANADAVAALNSAADIVLPVTNAAQTTREAERATALAAIGTMRARFPGAMGNMRVTVTTRLGQNVLSADSDGEPQVSQVQINDLVWLFPQNAFFIAERANDTWQFTGEGVTVALADLDPAAGHTVQIARLSVEVLAPGAFAQPELWPDLTVHSARLRDGIPNIFATTIANRATMLETPLIIESDASAVVLANGLIGNAGLADLPTASASGVTTHYQLSSGNDGVRPTPIEYDGIGDDDTLLKSGLRSFEELEEISIVAAPGVSYGANNGYGANYTQATQILISHCELMRYRVAVLDSPNDQSISQVRTDRAILDTTRAAFYHPWVRIQDPITRQQIHLPPSGFVAGIYARNDIDNGVHKAPANEVVRGAIGLEVMLNKSQQDVLNPLGVNCIRFFENRGIRVWGARTVSSDPEWKYVNIRRYFAFLERSIERSTQWAVFEPNGETLWANVRRSVEDFLYNEWKSDHLAGLKPTEAYFVRCDRSTMTQNDLDNGRLICLIGVAPLYPAEFVIFRIGQWTADRPA